MTSPARASLPVILGCAAAVAGLAVKGFLLGDGLDTFFLLLVLPVAAVAWRVGFAGGFAATLVAGFGDLWFFRPAPSVAPGPEDAVQLGAFLFVGATIAVLAEVRRRTLEHARATQEAGALATHEAELALDRLTGLERLLERLASTTTTNQVADAVLGHAVPLVGADSGRVVVLEGERGRARVITDGSGQSRDILVHEVPALADVLLLGRPLWRARDSALPPSLGEPDVVVPLRGGGPVIGALALRWLQPPALDRVAQALVEAVATQCGQTLERAVLFDTERRSRRDAETSRQEALRLRDELGAVLQSIGEPILVVAPDEHITLVNRAADRLLGPIATVEELRDRLRPVHAEPAALEPGQVLEAALEGTDRTVVAAVFGIRGRPTGSRVIALRDVTEVRRAEEAREVFIGVLSHELRTPVTTILGGVDLLARGLAEEDRRAVMDDVAAESERLRRLVEDVLVLSRFERHALRVEDEPVLIHHLVKGVASDEHRRTDPPVDIKVRIAPDLPPVRGDGAYLEQILRNLVGNAVKYGGAHGPVMVEASGRDGSVDVVVADSGPGFPDSDADRLFDLFYRSSRTSMKPGAGIGLFVARQLARSMGGELVARSRPGRGAEFVLSLRAFRPPEELAAQAIERERAASVPSPSAG